MEEQISLFKTREDYILLERTVYYIYIISDLKVAPERVPSTEGFAHSRKKLHSADDKFHKKFEYHSPLLNLSIVVYAKCLWQQMFFYTRHDKVSSYFRLIVPCA